VQIVNAVIANHDQRGENNIDYLAIVRLFAAANCFPGKPIGDNSFTFQLEKKNRLPLQMLSESHRRYWAVCSEKKGGFFV